MQRGTVRKVPLALVIAFSAMGAAQTAHAAVHTRNVEPVRHTLGVGLGIRADSVRDDLLIPLGFSGPGFRLLGSYNGLLGPGWGALRADLGMAYLWDRMGRDAMTIDYGVLATWVAPVVLRTNWLLALGPALALDSRVNNLWSWDDTHAYWLGSEWLGVAIEHRQRIWGQSRIDTIAMLGLVGFIGRPPEYRYNKQDPNNQVGYYLLRPHQHQHGTTLTEFQAARLDVALVRGVTSATAIAKGLKFGADMRLTRTDALAMNVNMSASLYAAVAWSL